MPKTNKKGRNKHTPFVMLHRAVTGSAAWISLSCVARCLLIEIWQRHNGKNNGQIAFSHRQARAALRVGTKKISEAFRDLEARGFIVARTKGSFNFKIGAGEGKATEWELTTEECDGRPAKNLYRKWPENQTTGTDAVAAGNHAGNRSLENGTKNSPSGNRSSSRSGTNTAASGNRTGGTYNMPGGEGRNPKQHHPIKTSAALLRPFLEGLVARGFLPDVAMMCLTNR